ncbi:MAG: HigA family addiction module antitoxin [Betaproteobacteria bacterium]
MPRLAIHPGAHLAEQLQALQMSAAEFARRIDVPTNRITELMNEKRSVTADTALRLARAFNTSARFWMNLQNVYDLRVAEATTAKQMTKIGPVASPVAIARRRAVEKHAH